MDELLWLNLNWPTWLFLVAVAVSVIAIKFARYTGCLLLALVLYLGVSWQTYDWVLLLFWAAWLIGLLGSVFGLVNGGGLRAARFGVWIALPISILLSQSTFPSWVGNSDVKEMTAAITSQLGETNASVEAMATTLNKSDTAQAQVNASVDQRLANVEKRLTTVETSLNELSGRVGKLESGVNMTSSPADLPVEKTSEGLAQSLVDSGFAPDDIRVGTVNWDENPMDTGTRVFGERIESRQELAERLNGTSAESRAMREHLQKAVPVSEQARTLSGQGHVPVQFLQDTCYTGNTYFKDGQALRSGVICRAKGDIVWVYVASNGTPVWDASVRADCANPGYTKPPAPKGKKPAPPKAPGTPTSPAPSSSPTPSKTSPVPSKPPVTSPSPPVSSPTPPVSSPTPSASPSPTPPGKDPSKDPQTKGNNKPGGGGTAPPVTGPASPPAAGQPPATYTPPPAPTASAAPGASPAQPDRTPPPNQGAPTTAPVPSDGPSGPACNPAICGD